MSNMINYNDILEITPEHSYTKYPELEFSLALIAAMKESNIVFDSALEFAVTSDKSRDISPFAGRNLYALKEFYPEAEVEGCDVFCPGKIPFDKDGIRYTYADIYSDMPYKSNSFDVVLVPAMLMDATHEDAKKAIENAKRIARKYVVLVDIQSEDEGMFDTGREIVDSAIIKEDAGHNKSQVIYFARWMRDYKKYFTENQIDEYEMPKEYWPGQSYSKSASIMVFHL